MVQEEALNRSRIATVVIVPLTSNLRWADVPVGEWLSFACKLELVLAGLDVVLGK